MDKKEYKNAASLIDNITAYTQQILEKTPHKDSDSRTLHDKADLVVIKMQCLKSFKDLLAFCLTEYTEQKSHRQATLILGIKNRLRKNLDFDIADNLTLQKLETFGPVLNDLKAYVTHQIEFQHAECDDAAAIKEFLKPKPGDPNILFVNKQFERLKSLLYYANVTFTPSTTHLYLRASLYRSIGEKEMIMILAEIHNLLKNDFFDIYVKANEPWIRAINFLNQLKNIFEDKKAKFRLIAKRNQENIQQAQVSTKKSWEKYSNKNMNFSVSTIPVPKKTFEDHLKEADQDFMGGGIQQLQRAQQKYEYILKNFFGHNEEAYIESQISIIKKRLLDIINHPPQYIHPLSQDTPSNEKISPSGKMIDPKTGKIRNDDFADY